MVEFLPISEAVQQLPQWKSMDGRTAIQRKFRFKDFPRAWSFLTEVAMNSLNSGVTPEIINNAERVTLILSGEDFSLRSECVEFAKAVDSFLPTDPPKTKPAKKPPSSRPAR